MQSYGKNFARIYNLRWNQFTDMVAPKLETFFEEQFEVPATLLDLCCGTGRMISIFADKGYKVTGIDLSEHMLEYARENNTEHIRNRRVELIQADAQNFKLRSKVRLAVSTYDAINHIPNLNGLQKTLSCVYHALEPGGCFVFDLNTELGLRTTWGNSSVREMNDATIIIRGLFDDEMQRAYTRMSGFVKNEQGTWDRFDEVMYNTAFKLKDVADMITRTGFSKRWFASLEKLDAPLTDPESQYRVFVVAIK